MKTIELDPNSIHLATSDALDNFLSGIKSEETKKPMQRNLKIFLEKVCKKLLNGDLTQRAQEFVDLAKSDQQKALAIISSY